MTNTISPDRLSARTAPAPVGFSGLAILHVRIKMRKKYPIRSLTEVAGWPKTNCARCNGEFWVLPSKLGVVIFCSPICNDEPPEIRFWKSVTKDGPMHPTEPELGCCWNSKFTPTSPYPLIKINGGNVRAARFVLELTLSRPLAEKLEACHSCDNMRCVNPAHLSEDTHRENIKGAMKRGRNPKGESHGNAVLNDEIVRHLRRLKGTMTCNEASAQTGINFHTIANVWSGDAWKHISIDPPS